MRKVVFGLALAASLALSGCGSGSNPAATVNGHDISMRDYNVAVYNQRVKTVDGKGYDPCAVKGVAPECALLEHSALDSLISKELVREYADAHNLTVTQADANRAWLAEFKGTFRGRQDVLNAFVKRLHETEDDLKAAVTTDLQRQRVMYAVIKNVPARAPAVQLAVIEATVKVLPQVKAALHFKAFSVVAREELQDPASGCANLKCGELGWVPTVLIPSSRGLLATSPIGAIIQYPHQQYFELYQVERKDPHYALTQQQQYQIRVNRFNAWLSQQQRKASVKRFVSV